MISTEVEEFLHKCFVLARQGRMESISVEFMVLNMLDQETVMERFARSGLDLAGVKSALHGRIDVEPKAVDEGEPDTQPSMKFQRVIQKAIMAAQSRGAAEVVLLDLLDAVQAEPDSFAGRLLSGHAVVAEAPCGFCRKSVATGSLVTVAGRGLICAECIAAIAQLKQ
jgi:ATP-dependent Clp protease ATP-binding subunit ClpA